MKQAAFLCVAAALMLAACDEQETAQSEPEPPVSPSAETAEEVAPRVPEGQEQSAGDVVADVLDRTEDALSDAAEETATTLEGLSEQAETAVNDALESTEGLREETRTALEDAGDTAADALTAVQEQANDALNSALDEGGVLEGAGEVVSDTTESLAGLLEGAAGAVDQALNANVAVIPPADVDWQSTYTSELYFRNLSEQPINALTGPGDGEVVASVPVSQGGFIEGCNASLDWCLLNLDLVVEDEGVSGQGWVPMADFGAIAD